MKWPHCRIETVLHENGLSVAFDVFDANDDEHMLTGFIKWEGCIHFRQPDPEIGYLHICGRDSFKSIIDALYDRAKELMGDKCIY